jgi:hypothetical protein
VNKIALLIALFVCVPARATWTLAHSTPKCTGTSTTDGCSSSPCTLSGLTAVTAGNSLIAVLLDDVSNRSISSINGETWTHCTGCSETNSQTAVDASYVDSATGGETSFAMTLSSSTGAFNFCIFEGNSSTGSVGIDTGASSGACKSVVSSAAPVSCTLTVSGANLLVVTGFVWSGDLTSITSPCADFVSQNGNGVGAHVSTTSGTGCAWGPTTSGTGPEFSIALKEATGSTSCTGQKSLTGVGCR